MIRNTSKDEVRPEWLMGGNPRAIEKQEAQGQGELCASSQLPRQEGMSNDARIKYEKLGIKVLRKTPNDELFYDVELPKGWSIKPTDHSMWSELFDCTGKKIAAIFYKAAFYDRGAHIHFEK